MMGTVMRVRLWPGVSLIIRGSEIVTLESEALSGVWCAVSRSLGGGWSHLARCEAGGMMGTMCDVIHIDYNL